MKIRMKELSYDKVLEQKKYRHKKPMKQWVLLRKLVRVLSAVLLWKTGFTCKQIGMEKLDQNQPCLILMNHSGFVDLEIVATLFSKRPYQIVTTLDGFVGKAWLMRLLGCIPTKKFVTDPTLVRDMVYAVKDLKSSVIMFPEAGYSFDGTATVLPESLGKCLKILNVPVVMVRTYGAFHKNPLYNELQNRKIKISAEVEYLLSPEDIRAKSPEELNAVLNEQFSFDHFRWQEENGVRVTEKFRADGLHRVLYKCPHCQSEGQMKGEGIHLTCMACQKQYELTEYGKLKAVEGITEIDHIPDWYRWQRECVRQELETEKYRLDVPVDIYILNNIFCIYKVGDGRLVHSKEGFYLSGCDGKLDYRQAPGASYSLNSDFFWYEIGDVIAIGTSEIQYYCFPKGDAIPVAKTRLATEELYKMTKTEKRIRRRKEPAVS